MSAFRNMGEPACGRRTRIVIGLMTLTQPLASSIAQLNQQAMALYSSDDFAAALSTVLPAIEHDESTLDDAALHALADALNIAGASSCRLGQLDDAERH
ncbi:hypothetical protein JNB70_25600, partial [Rhizobium pusense]|uniref:hypothetical protein n=1 Tax=Agrobacterium pusense TaxID=648995 RepID=UPI001C6F2DAC